MKQAFELPRVVTPKAVVGALVALLVSGAVGGYVIWAIDELRDEQTTIERRIDRIDVNPVQAFTPRQWCFVVKSALSSRSFRLRVGPNTYRGGDLQVRCKRLGLHGESERGLPSFRLPLPRGGDADGGSSNQSRGLPGGQRPAGPERKATRIELSGAGRIMPPRPISVWRILPHRSLRTAAAGSHPGRLFGSRHPRPPGGEAIARRTPII